MIFWGIRLSAPLQDHRLPGGSRRGSADRSTYTESPGIGSKYHGFPFIFSGCLAHLSACVTKKISRMKKNIKMWDAQQVWARPAPVRPPWQEKLSTQESRNRCFAVLLKNVCMKRDTKPSAGNRPKLHHWHCFELWNDVWFSYRWPFLILALWWNSRSNYELSLNHDPEVYRDGQS